MLVLSRKHGESIVLNGEIIITIKNKVNGKTELLIDAPKNIQVDRLELHKLKATKAQTPYRNDLCRKTTLAERCIKKPVMCIRRILDHLTRCRANIKYL